MNNSPTAPGALAITANPAQPKLTPKQKEFNRLVARVERLRIQVAATAAEFDACLNHYVEHLLPIEVETASARAALVCAAYKFWPKSARLTAKHGTQLRSMLLDMIDGLLVGDASDSAELIEIQKQLEGDDYVPFQERLEEEREADFAAMRAAVQQFAAQHGLEVDFDQLPANPTGQDIQQHLADQVTKKQQASENPTEHASRKPPRVVEAEQRQRELQDAKDRSISTIYKQLARLLHPDLEQDPAIKLRKEHLMKQVTVAYQANDLHTLLSLELQWLHGEGHDTSKLSDQKLAVYNEVLRDQINELELSHTMVYGHPRYAALRDYFDGPKDVKLKRLKKEVVVAQAACEGIAHLVLNLKQANGARHLKALLAQWAYDKKLAAMLDQEDLYS